MELSRTKVKTSSISCTDRLLISECEMQVTSESFSFPIYFLLPLSQLFYPHALILPFIYPLLFLWVVLYLKNKLQHLLFSKARPHTQNQCSVGPMLLSTTSVYWHDKIPCLTTHTTHQLIETTLGSSEIEINMTEKCLSYLF